MVKKRAAAFSTSLTCGSADRASATQSRSFIFLCYACTLTLALRFGCKRSDGHLECATSRHVTPPRRPCVSDFVSPWLRQDLSIWLIFDGSDSSAPASNSSTSVAPEVFHVLKAIARASRTPSDSAFSSSPFRRRRCALIITPHPLRLREPPLKFSISPACCSSPTISRGIHGSTNPVSKTPAVYNCGPQETTPHPRSAFARSHSSV